MLEPLVSIVMPAYNASKFISESIESVLKQTYKNWELIIVNDCSKDNTEEIIKSYSNNDSRIKYYNQKTNLGISEARNKAIIEAKGEYIAFLDSDDLWKKRKLEEQIKFMEEKKINFSYTDYEKRDQELKKTIKNVKCPIKIDYKEGLKGNKIGCLTVIIRSSILKENLMPKLKHEDYATWLKILRKGEKAFGLQKNLAIYRATSNSISSNKLKVLFWTFPIYYIQEKLGIMKSLYYLNCHLLQALKKF